MTEYSKKIYEIIKNHPEFDSQIVANELKMMDRYDVVEHAYVLYQQLSEKDPGDINPLNSLVLYLLGTTTKRPEAPFELKKRRTYARKGFPDIDMDFDCMRRHEIVEYLIEKYGRECVGNIGLVQKLKTKAAIRRVIKVLDPTQSRKYNEYGKEIKGESNANFALENAILDEINKATLIVGGKLRTKEGGHLINSVKAAYTYIPGFKRYMDAYPEIIKYASLTEGSISAYGAHAAGIVLSPIPLEEICPLHFTQDKVDTEITGKTASKTTSEKQIATQWTMTEVESMGLIKIDVLGVSTRTAISWALQTIKDNHNVSIDINHLPLDDKETLQLIRSGKTAGCFQLESWGMQEAVKQINITKFMDLIIAIAMFRPGPMDYIPELAERKNGRRQIIYSHPLIETITKPTYGILCFQESLMQAFMMLANLTASDGYDFMKGCAKKQDHIIAGYKEKFFRGAKENNISDETIQKIWADFEKFGSYAFNLAHATSYAHESWKTCYLKAHYPTEFIEARLSVENIRRKFKLVEKYEMDAIRNYGFKILPVDLNASKIRYSIEGDKVLRKPILIKGIGLKAATEIVEHQPYHGKDPLWIFGQAVDKAVTTKVMETMHDIGLWPGYNKSTLIKDFEGIKKDKQINRHKPKLDLFE